MVVSSLLRRALGAGAVFCVISISIADAKAEKIVAAGHSTSLLTAASIDPNCHSQGPVTVNVIDPPRGGFLEVTQIKAFPNFNTLNTRSQCNTLKLPATEVIYQSAGNFLGTDTVTLELVFPGGNARRVRVPVTVRPVTANFAPAPPAGAETLAPVPDAPAHSKKVARHKKSAFSAAARHRPCQGGCESSVKGADHPAAPVAAPKSPLVNI